MSVRSPDGASASVATTWAISVDQLRREEPRAVDLLNLCAFLAPEPIPRSLLAEHHEALPPTLGRAIGSPLRLSRRIGALRRYRLVDVAGKDLIVHRSVQAATRDQLTGSKRRRWVEAAVALMRAAFPFDRDDPSTWGPSGALISHALAVAHHAEETATDLKGARDLLHASAGYFERRAELRQAKRLLERARDLAEQALGPEDPEVAQYVNNLGYVLRDLGDLAGARAAYERALLLAEKHLGSEHPNVATTVGNLGLVLNDLGDLAGAKANYERALKIDENSFGSDHPNVARDVNNLGLLLQDLGDLAGAKAAYERRSRSARRSMDRTTPRSRSTSTT
jgi:tetratricopeptide (TPR) repeat protein